MKDKNALYLKAITEGSKVEPSVEDSGSIQDAIADISKFKGTNFYRKIKVIIKIRIYRRKEIGLWQKM